jgi:glycosyltransferase involved in cell wall biosynthesis
MKVLHLTNALDVGGIENLIKNIVLNDKSSNNEYHIALSDGRESHYDRFFLKNNIRLHYFDVETKKPSLVNYFRNLKRISKLERFDVIHSHLYFFSGWIVLISFIFGFKTRISHIHDTEKGRKMTFSRRLYQLVSRNLIKMFSTKVVAVSESALNYVIGKSIDEKKYFVIKNGILSDHHTFDLIKRNNLRKKYKVSEESIVFGSAARFVHQKNHKVIIDSFNEIYITNKNVYLFLAGEGELLDNYKSYVNKLKCSNNVIFLGNIDEVNYFNSFLDVYLMPSLYEGLPISLIEAICSGLKCYISDLPVLREFFKFDNVYSYSNLINTYDNERNLEDRIKYKYLIEKEGLNLEKTIYDINRIYKGE